MDYDEYGDYDDENDFMDVEEAIEVPDKKAKKSDVVDILNDLADGEGKDGLKKGRVEPKVRKPMGSRIFLTERRLTAPTGIRALINSFKGYKPRTGGKNPYADLKDIMKKMELWAHSVAPNMEFNDFIARAQTLGRKRAVTTHMLKIRNGMEYFEEDEESEKNDNDEGGKEKVSKPKAKKDAGEPIHFC